VTIAASVERPHQGKYAVKPDSFWRRLAVILALIISDLACFLLGDLLLRLVLRSGPPGLVLFPGSSHAASHQAIDLILLIALVFTVGRYLVGDYSRRQLFWDSARSTTSALLICALLYLAAIMLLQPMTLLTSAAVWLGLIFLLPTARQGMRYFLSRAGLWNLPTALLGTSQTAQEVYPTLARQLALGLDVRWVVPESAEKHVPASLAGLKALIAGPDELTRTLIQAGCRQVILVPDDNIHVDQAHLIDQLVGADIRVAIVPSLRRLPLFGLSTNYFFGKDFLLLQVRNNLARLPQRMLKRSIDVLVSLAAAILLSPLFLVMAMLIKLEDGGPVFFLQSRVGRGGRDFRCWKFRTMVVDAEALMARWEREDPILLAHYRQSNFKLKTDPRVTRVGAWLRRTSLDELPQLINILCGEMSMVGPRPLLRRELPDYGAVISLYERVRPGITGLWQISGRSHTTFAERVSYDEWYIKNWTVWYDVVILLQTVWVLMRGGGAY
jgi:undecaprenyl-phosphate galactose phosphotransferase